MTPVQVESFKPSYFLMGRPETKIQLSFKIRLVDEVPFYFGYTQLMLWDLFYFTRDLNFNPEVFYRFQNADPSQSGIDLGLYEHRSNGKGGDNEQAWNRTYLRYYSSRTNLGGNTTLRWSVSGWIPYWFKPATLPYPQYNGIWEAEATLRNLWGDAFECADLQLRIYPGGPAYINPLLGGQEITFQFKSRNWHFRPLTTVQFFHGHGESLANTVEERLGFRAGLGFKLGEP